MRKRTVLLLLVPSVAVATPVITEYVEIDKPASDAGKLSLEDTGTQATIGAGAVDNWFRLIRADGAGYISNNASFTGSSSGGSWMRDNNDGMSILEEFGEGNWGVFLAPKNPINPPNPIVWTTVLNAEFTGIGVLNGPMVVQVPIERLFIGKTKTEELVTNVDAALRVITRTSIRPLYVRGSTSTLANFASSSAGGKALVLVGDGPDENNAGYLAVGIDPTGSQVGYGAGGSFVSTGKNGTGSARNLVLHTYNATDVVIAAGNTEKARFTASGNVGIGTSAPTATLSVNGTANKPGGGSWSVFSDERLKHIHGTFDTGLDAVMKLRPVRYEYKQNNALGLVSNGEHIGFSAQAVERAIPEAVTRNAAGYLMVNNDPILLAMLNAIQEQQRMLQAQQLENQQLRARVEKLEHKARER